MCFLSFAMVTVASAQNGFVTIRTGDVEDITHRLGSIPQVHGLFVGVTSYQNPTTYKSLGNAAGDAREIEAAFARRCGGVDSKVLVDQHATLVEIRAALKEIGARCGPDDLFIFHFSGHGLGLKSKDGRLLKGLLMLHDAPPLAELWRGEFGHGVIDLDLLEGEMVANGVRAKHRLIILDSCYGGLGAYARSPAIAPLDTQNVARYWLQHSVTYVISAGGAEQTVLDGPAGGRGLLTGAIVDALKGEPGLPLVTVGGQRYLAFRDCFKRFAVQISETARSLMENSTAAVEKGIRSPDAGPNQVQVPLDLSRGGEGQIFIPWRERGEVATPSAGMMAHGSTGTARSAEECSDLAEWGANSALGRHDPTYAEKFRELGRLLASGPPNEAGQQLQVAVEPLIRVQSDIIRKLMQQPPDGSSDEDLAQSEALRTRVQDADWMRPSEDGNRLTTAHELGLVLYNFSGSPVYFYVIAIDGRANVQLLAGADSAAARLNARTGRTLPGVRDILADKSARRQVSFGWRIGPENAGVEQALIVVASARPWLELAELATHLERAGKNTETRNGLLTVLPARFGAVGESVLCSEPENEQRLPRGVIPIGLTPKGSWLGLTFGWKVSEAHVELTKGGN